MFVRMFAKKEPQIDSGVPNIQPAAKKKSRKAPKGTEAKVKAEPSKKSPKKGSVKTEKTSKTNTNTNKGNNANKKRGKVDGNK
jgi:hypothetical protein